MKSFFVAANWKMHKSPGEAAEFIKDFKSKFKAIHGRDILICPSYLSLTQFKNEFGETDILFGAQNCHFEDKGAFTGEISPLMLKQVGVPYCLVGHSERRHVFGETDEILSKKVAALDAHGVVPILCVGETEEERLAGKTLECVERQLATSLGDEKKIIVAYEPVWAIGTGRVPSVSDINEVHNFLRESLLKKWGNAGTDVALLYGGSVKPENCADIENIENVNGFLIGGASLKVDSYLSIYKGG